MVELTKAQVRAAIGHGDDLTQAEAALQNLVQEATQSGFADYALQARLALGELEMLSNAANGRQLLEAVQKDSTEKGFGLIAKKAARVLNSTSGSAELSQSRVN